VQGRDAMSTSLCNAYIFMGLYSPDDRPDKYLQVYGSSGDWDMYIRLFKDTSVAAPRGTATKGVTLPIAE